jgi:hypothetical protein
MIDGTCLVAIRFRRESQIGFKSIPQLRAALNLMLAQVNFRRRVRWQGDDVTAEALLNGQIAYLLSLTEDQRESLIGQGLNKLDEFPEPLPPARQVGKVVDPPPERSALTVRPVPEPPAKRRPKARSKKKKGDEM